MIFGEKGGKVGVAVGDGASVKTVAVSVGGTCVRVSVGVPVGMTGVFVIVTIMGVGVKIEGVIVGGGAGNVGTLYTQPSQAVMVSVSRKISKMNFFIVVPLLAQL